MSQFLYKAIDRSGKTVTGKREGTDRRAVLRSLQLDSLKPLSVVEEPGKKKWNFSFNKTGAEEDNNAASIRANKSVGLAILKQLLELHASGMAIADAIRTLSQRVTDPNQKKVCEQLWTDLGKGSSMAKAMGQMPQVFSVSITTVVEAGEATGNLVPILEKIIEYLEEKNEVRSKVLGSLGYPIFITTVASGVVLFFLFYLLPQIRGMLESLGGELTLSAKILIEGADILMLFGPFILGGLIVGSITFVRWRKNEKARELSDAYLLKIPVVGELLFLNDLYQFSSLAATLLNSGIHTTKSLALVEKSVENRDLRRRFQIARTQVNEGVSVARAFRMNRLMPDMSLDILMVGEDTGNLTRSLTDITKSFRVQLTKRLATFTTMISTGALIFAFLLVGLVAMGIVSSILQVSRSISL